MMQRILTEKEAEDFLEKNGFKIVKRAFAKSLANLKKITKKISFPWVMKASSRDIVHKAKSGGVILNIRSLEEAESSFSKLSKLKEFEEAIIQETISGEEIIIGLKKTPEFGVVLLFGHGGSKVEEEKDIAFRIPPLKEIDIEELIKDIRFYKIIEQKCLNLNELKKVLMKTAKLSKKYKNITELDINPLIINSKEAQIVDARIVLEDGL